MFDGADDLMQEDRPVARGVLCFLLSALVIGLLLTLLWASRAYAQQSQPSECSGTATSTSTAIVFPKSGETGPAFPSQFLTISNPSASATLWVCAGKGCTAAANAAGSIVLSPVTATGQGQNTISWFKGLNPPPARVSILSSASESSFTCNYE